MGDQIGGVLWSLLGIIFGSFCDGGFWLGQVKRLIFAIMLVHLEAGKHHHRVLQLEPLEVWSHRRIGVGYGVCSVSTRTIYIHYNVIYLFC